MQTLRSQLLIFGTLFQGLVTIVAFIVAWFLQINPFDHFQCDGPATALGIVATIPMVLFFVLVYQIPVGPLRDVKRFLIDSLGPYLSDCRWCDLAWLALSTGIAEELLFRAVLQNWINRWDSLAALVISNIIFGLAHAVTPLYPLLAGLLGAYLGSIYQFVTGGNLFVPAIAHGLYDFIGFLIVRHSFRSEQRTLNQYED